jgi:hypothetical protein
LQVTNNEVTGKKKIHDADRINSLPRQKTRIKLARENTKVKIQEYF